MRSLMHGRSRQLKAVGGSLACVAVLIATASCSNGTTDSSSGQANGVKSITLAMPFAPITLDPCNSVAGATGTILRENITETLTRFDAATGKLNPLLAQSWKAESPTVWTFTLRKGVKFHDGTTFNAQNAIPSLKRDMDKGLNCINLVNSYLSTVVSIEATDDYTLKFTTSTPTPTLPAQLAKEDIAAPSTPAE